VETQWRQPALLRGQEMDAMEQWNKACWHLIHTHPKQEARAEVNLKTLNVETYVPIYKRRRYNQVTGARTDEYKPLFPNYVFARFSINDLYHKVRFTRGVRDLVCFDQKPAVVDDAIVSFIRSRQLPSGAITLEEFKPGDEVVIKDGPFEKLRAIFERRTCDVERVVLLLNSVGYQSRIIVDIDSIAKVGPEFERPADYQ
jgi:transcription elongation factor/antiterminator RfaH